MHSRLVAFLFVGGIQLGVCMSAFSRQADPLICESQGFPAFCFMTTSVNRIQFGDVSWGDFDSDGDMDLVVSGNRATRSSPDPFLSFYRNDGERAVPGPPPAPNQPPSLDYQTAYSPLATEFNLHDGSTAIGDIDGDGRIDAAATGVDADGALVTVFWLNTSQASMSFEFFASHPGLRASSIAFGDADNDGDLDLVLSGLDEDEVATLWIAENEFLPAQGRVFTFHDTGLQGAAHGRVVWGDYDGDGDRDLLVSGNVENQGVVRIYRNDGGTFVDAMANIRGGLFASADWGDYDGDGDLDVLVAGGQIDPFVLSGFTRILRNDGGAYVEVAVLDGMFHGTAAWVDYDNDGDLDAFVSGGERVGGEALGIFLDNTGGGFERSRVLGGGLFGGAALADYDYDGDTDVMLFGNLSTQVLFTQEYRNEIAQPNAAPGAPSGANAVVTGNSVQLSWSASTDDHTPSAGLTYNVRIGVIPTANRMPSMSAPDGRRLVTARGNVDHSLSWTISDLEPGTWTWQVQAIDGSGVGSAFTAEQQFVVAPE